MSTDSLGIVRLEMEVPIEAPIDKVWKLMIEDTTRWWRRELFTVTDPILMCIEPKAGGRMFERGADGTEVLWGLVTEFSPGRSIGITGHIAPRWGGPAVATYSFTLEERGQHTVLKLSDCTWGRVDDKLAKSLEGGWSLLFNLGLKPYVESH